MNDQQRLLRLPDVQALTGLAKTTIYTLEKKGTFPQRRKLTQRASGWLESEIAAWINSRPGADGTRP